MPHDSKNRPDRTALRQTGGYRTCRENVSRRFTLADAMRLRRSDEGNDGRASRGAAEGMCVWDFATQTWDAQDAALSRVGRDENAVLQPESSPICALWRQGYQRLQRMAGFSDLRGLGERERLQRRIADRQDRQQRQLRTEQLPICNSRSKHGKSGLLLASGALLLSGCVGSAPIASTPSACSALIPDSWRQPVAGAELPEGNTVGDWIAFGDAQTGRLDVANGRQADTLAIIGRCEERDKLAVKKSRPRFLGLF